MKIISKLEKIYDDILNLNIHVYNFRVSNTKKAACMHTKTIKAIAIDKKQIKSSFEERTILIEESSHYESNSLYFIEATCNTPIGRQNRIVFEAKARQYAIKKHLPFDELRDAIHDGHINTYELAEYFEVTEDFIKSAIKYYKENCGLDFNE